ncbi:MAG: hypothetical protein KatS3mg082_3273 [Nitrospiraceae bacterium]|nr:MAG: hypothetical protein KatS3mg081_1383 [Gemmatimonadales bacterium]GIW56869.1 MAG: hypothetical protein KatS3mg082_3273 [Nitrospiraceae bacterium]
MVPMLVSVLDLRRAARRALQAGFSHAELRNALLAEARAVEEERMLDPRYRKRIARMATPGWRWWTLRLSCIGFGSAVMLAGAEVDPGPGASLLLLSGMLLLLLGAMPILARDWAMNPLTWVERFMFGRGGRLLFKLAGIGLKRPERVAPALEQRTELLVGAAAEELWGELPSELRRRIPEVPQVIRRLKEDATQLRRREERLSDALARVDLTGGSAQGEVRRDAARELEQAREVVRERLAGAVAALEGLRLDLLRLAAGVASTDDLTADLERARAVHEAVEAALAGRRDVEQILADTLSG